jgi:membrane-associated phospholipid phosphatase
VASSVWAYGLVPAAVIAGAFTTTGPYATDGAGWRAMTIVAESALVSAAITQGLKFGFARKRPFVRYGAGETSGAYDVTSSDSRASFPSGHTSLVASLGSALATTATLQESDAAPWLWAGAAFATVTTGALRMMAEKHYFTDVVAGAAVGAACGAVVPLLHRRGGPLSSGSVSIAAQGPSFALSGRF